MKLHVNAWLSKLKFILSSKRHPAQLPLPYLSLLTLEGRRRRRQVGVRVEESFVYGSLELFKRSSKGGINY